MYHSIFTPDGHLRMANLVPTVQNKKEAKGQVSNVMAIRQTCVTTESDLLAEYLQGLEGTAAESDHGYDVGLYLSMLFASDVGVGDVSSKGDAVAVTGCCLQLFCSDT